MRPPAASTFRSRLAVRLLRGRRPVLRVVSLLMVPAFVALAACAPNPTTRPSYAGDFPDPSVIRVGGLYFAFSTQGAGGNIQRLVSTDHKNWVMPAQSDALPVLPKWADSAGTWAPDVVQIGNTYVMYYSAHMAGGRHCLTAAVSASPATAFVDNSARPMLCMANGETIDPATVIGPYNLRYMVWKGPDAKGVATLYAQRLSTNGMDWAGPRVVLMKAKPGTWTSYNIEAPYMLFTQNKWFLFYSGGNYWSSKYSIGYATCSGPLGPCVDRTPKKPWVASHGGAQGPGGESFFTDANGTLYMAYHAWGAKQGYNLGGLRSLWIDQVGVLNGVPLFAL